MSRFASEPGLTPRALLTMVAVQAGATVLALGLWFLLHGKVVAIPVCVAVITVSAVALAWRTPFHWTVRFEISGVLFTSSALVFAIAMLALEGYLMEIVSRMMRRLLDRT